MSFTRSNARTTRSMALDPTNSPSSKHRAQGRRGPAGGRGFTEDHWSPSCLSATTAGGHRAGR
eukprot:5173046-Prymnesium_polylepis.2